MVCKTFKFGGLVLAIAVVGGLFLFGSEMFSYARTSVNQVRSTAKDAVSLEFELARARDLLDDVMPELQANIRLIAQEEVEIAELKSEIARSIASLDEEKQRLTKVRGYLDSTQTRFVVAGRQYDRDDLAEELSRGFDRYKEAEMILHGKQRLLETREKSLTTAISTLEDSRGKKLILEDKIAALEGQYRLVKSASQGTRFQIDDSKMAKTERLIGEIKKRLDVAERVLARESQFTQSIVFDEPVNEQELLAEVDAYFDAPATTDAEIDAAPVENPIVRLDDSR